MSQSWNPDDTTNIWNMYKREQQTLSNHISRGLKNKEVAVGWVGWQATIFLLFSKKNGLRDPTIIFKFLVKLWQI